MHSTLLLVVLGALSFIVEAAPLTRRHNLITLPLTCIHQARDNIHPEILLQQHMNRGHRRLAQIARCKVPTDEELGNKLRKRMRMIADGPSPVAKRYNSYTPSIVPPHISLDLHEEGDEGKERIDESDSNTNASSGNPGFSEAEIKQLLENGVTEGNTPTANDSLALDILGNDVGYTATFEIGNPPRPFRLLMDSGSADMWIPIDGCVSEDGLGSCGNRTFISEDKSSTFNLTNEAWNITYGSGRVSGFKVSDDVNIAGLTLTGHRFGVANNESSNFSGDSAKFDGLVGLALSSISNQDVLTPVEALAKEGLIDEAITSYKISRLFDGLNDGEITFGGLDESKFDTTSLVTIDNLSDGFWIAPLDAVTVDGADLGISSRSVILDTGTTLLIVPVNDANAIHKAIEGAGPDGHGGFVLPCNTNASLALTFGGTAFSIASPDLAFAPIDLNDPTGLCHSGIAGNNRIAHNKWLAGDTFLKSVYFSTNVNKNQLSLAKLT
ncbi:acid protease [Hymenopellis radicata]|nr:acid protease [Hymenopellis radicata]